MTVSEFISNVLSKINSRNLGYAIQTFDKGMDIFNKTLNDFGKSMDSMTKELSQDVAKSEKRGRSESKKNQKNIQKLLGSSKSVKIWSDDNKFKL
jgi:hypothetical protein